MRTSVMFRGEEREVNFFCIEWYFPDLDVDGHAALNITPEEEDAITDACAKAYESYDPCDYEGPSHD